MPISEFAKKRNEVLFSLDKEKILDFCGGNAPEDDEVFWAGVYKAICNITSTPPELREKAISWLSLHGYSPDIRLYPTTGEW